MLAVDGADEETVLDGLEAGVLTGLLVEPAPGRVRFAHALVRDTLYEDLPVLRRTRLHARALAALEDMGATDAAALARHALASVRPQTARRAVVHGAVGRLRDTHEPVRWAAYVHIGP